MKATFKLGNREFVIEAARIENRDDDIYADGELVAWWNIPDAGWFISGTHPGRPKDVTYWDSMKIT